MKSELQKLASKLAPLYAEEAGANDDLFDDDAPIVGLPRKLSSVQLPAARDELGAALNRLEEQSLLRTNAGLETAKAIRSSRKRAEPPPASVRDDDDEEEPVGAALNISQLPPFQARDVYDDELFKRLDQFNRDQDAIARPSLSETLVYAASLKDNTHGLWLQSSQLELIRQNRALDPGTQKRYHWPKIPECTRAYLEPFWWEPNRALKHERACSHVNCESLRLGGFRLREWMPPEDLAKVMVTKDRAAKDGGQWLPEIPGWCIMCHLSVTNELYLASFNRLQERRQVHGVPDEQLETQLYVIHHFCVHVDIVGEYRLAQTLAGHPNIVGLFGFFPVYNVQNYVAVKRGTQQGWRESDELVFRLAQATSDQIESSRTTQRVAKLVF